MAWLISDANIIIDMETGGMLEWMFQLPEAIATADALYEEELAEQHAYLLEMGLKLLAVEAAFVLETARLSTIYRKPSHNDLLALALAKQEESPLLTGDARLREAAEQEGVEVHGTLWLVKAIFDANIASVEQVEQAYSRMQQGGRRLPLDAVRRQVESMKRIREDLPKS